MRLSEDLDTPGADPGIFSDELCALMWQTSWNLVEVMQDHQSWCHSAHELFSFVASSILWAVSRGVLRDAM